MTPSDGRGRVLALKRFGATWWGKEWIKALEGRARLDPNRLPRGRTYARQSRVGELTVTPGVVTAGVSGSRPTPYIVRLAVRTLSEGQWDALLDVIAARAGHAAALLDGELDPGVADDAAAAGTDLLPGAGELTTSCSCPDWAEPCKHAAAVCYLVADVLDADPFALLLLRGRGRDEVLAGIRSRRASVDPAVARDQLTPDLGDEGVVAREAFARWQAQPAPTPPPVPLPPAHAGDPVPLAVDPPAGSGVTRDDLAALAADAARRAWELSTGDGDGDLGLTVEDDLARRGAALLGAGRPGRSRVDQLARHAGLLPRRLRRSAEAWQRAGRNGVAVLDDIWTPPAEVMEEARAALSGSTGASVQVRTNRVTVLRGTPQLRFGQDERWYRFDRVDGGWELSGGPAADIHALLDPAPVDPDEPDEPPLDDR